MRHESRSKHAVPYLVLVTACLVLGSACTVVSEEKVPLELELPRAQFVGTPTQIKLPNLEPARKGKRPDFMVPANVTNVAADKEVSSSDEYPVIGELEMITDGDKDGSEGSYVELGPGQQYVQVDLGKPHTLYAVVVWHYHSQARAYKDVIVQLSDDPDFISNVQTLFNNDYDASSGMGEGKDMSYIDTAEGRIIDAKGLTGRYLRLYSTGSTSDEMNHYVEVEVYGTPAD